MSKSIAYRTCEIRGTTSGEHSSHEPPHSPCTLYGIIDSNCSDMLFINGEPVALVGSTTKEWDCCCSSSTGTISEGSSLLFCNGKPIARVGDKVSPHDGTAHIITGSDFITDKG